MHVMENFIISSGLFMLMMYNLLYHILLPGTRCSEEKKNIIVDVDKVHDDSNEPGDKRTMIEMRKMANIMSNFTND